MSFKDTFAQEKADLASVKRPYESAAFILFSLLFVQQLAWLIRAFYRFAFDNTVGFFNTANWCNANLQGWVARIILIDSTNWLWVVAGIVAFILYYALVYLFVWNYCKKHNLAKWTWTLFVVYMPGNVIFMPPFLWFALYVFRPYVMRFIKRAVEEYKSFDPNHEFPEDVEESVEPQEEVQP